MTVRAVNLGRLQTWFDTSDPEGRLVYRARLEDVWEKGMGFSYHDPILARAIDGALRQALGLFSKDEKTIVTTYRFECPLSDNGKVFYRVFLNLADGTEISGQHLIEGLAIFCALWNHYQTMPEIKEKMILMGTLGSMVNGRE